MKAEERRKDPGHEVGIRPGIEFVLENFVFGKYMFWKIAHSEGVDRTVAVFMVF